jgi:hypothetical protein
MDFLLKYFDFILESSNSGRIVYSSEFRVLLKMVSDKTSISSSNSLNIAKLLLDIENKSEDTYTLIDLTDKNDVISMISISRINRSIETDHDISSFISSIPQDLRTNYIISNAYNKGTANWIDKLWSNQRTDVKIGRYAKRVLTSIANQTITIKDSDIEIFVNLYKSSFDYSKGLKDKFEIVSGNDIKKYYLEDIYESGGGSLNNSCMRYKKCQDYFDIYTKNPEVCQLLILKNERDRLIGRSIIWKLIDKKIYMDRVYTTNDSDINIFKNYAKEKGWVSYYDIKGIINVQLKKEEYVKFPYMDTFCSFNKETFILVNDEIRESDWYFLQNTDGSYISGGGIWSEYHGEYISEDEAIWCENINSYVHQDDAIWMEYKQEWAGPNEDIIWSEYDQESYYKEDSCYSNCMDTWLLESKSISIIIDSDENMDYCAPDRSDLYLNIGGTFYLRKSYVVNPFDNGYIFYNEIKDQISEIVKETTGDNGDGIKARGKISEISNIIFANGFSEKSIHAVRESESYKKMVNWWEEKFMYEVETGKYRTESVLTPKESLYYILYWAISEVKFDPRKWVASATYENLYNDMIILIDDDKAKSKYRNSVLRTNTSGIIHHKFYELDPSRIKQLFSMLTDIANKFDYSIFGNEFYILYLYLTS